MNYGVGKPRKESMLMVVLEIYIYIQNYEGYPASKFRWAIKKKNKNILQTMYIAI